MSATMSPTAPPVAGPEQKGRGAAGGKGAGKPVKITLSGDPTVQLLPPSIRDRALARSRMRAGILLVVLGAIVAAGLFAAGTVRMTQAELALLEANNRTAELLAQQATHTEAVKVESLLKQALELQEGATTTEIPWADLIRSLMARLPMDAELMSIEAVSVVPWDALPAHSEGVPRLATIDFTIASATIPDATAFSRSLAELDGYAGSTLSDVAVGNEGRVTAKLTLVLTTGAESGRFAADVTEDVASDPADQTEGTEG